MRRQYYRVARHWREGHSFSCVLVFPVLSWSMYCWFFFFSSRRRHTRCLSDWSSDVCSSDLEDGGRGEQYWRVVDERLKQAGVTRAQVQATWIKQADAGPRQGFPEYAKKLQAEDRKSVV